jgi:16S rRNA C967 or C1407 C5-methylase (RsmB/RsmF family)
MTAKTTTRFDLDAFKRAFEQWDADAILGLYADEVELVEINSENPPASPRVRRGRETIKGIVEGGAAVGVKAIVENGVADENRAAVAFTCEFPNGRRVVANSILELEDGLIVRQMEVQCGDPQ